MSDNFDLYEVIDQATDVSDWTKAKGKTFAHEVVKMGKKWDVMVDQISEVLREKYKNSEEIIDQKLH
jgi:hypothetical protein